MSPILQMSESRCREGKTPTQGHSTEMAGQVFSLVFVQSVLLELLLWLSRLRIQSLALLSGLRIWQCLELWCRSQMRLRSQVAVAVA